MAVALGLVPAGCAYLDSGVGLLQGQSGTGSAASRDGFPSLSSVPAKPEAGSTADERDAMKAELMADRGEAQKAAAGRTSLWPNVPAPADAGAARTSARVGHPLSAPPAPVAATAGSPPLPASPPKPDSAAPAPAGAQPPETAATEESDKTAAQPAAAPTFDLRPALGEAPQTAAARTAPTQSAPLRFTTFSEVSNAAGVIGFGHGSVALSAHDLRLIADLAKNARQSGTTVRVIGHASMRTQELDPFDHTIANFQISLLRANAVAAALRANGVSADRITVEAAGDSQPLFSEAMPSGEAGNRRVEIYLDAS